MSKWLWWLGAKMYGPGPELLEPAHPHVHAAHAHEVARLQLGEAPGERPAQLVQADRHGPRREQHGAKQKAVERDAEPRRLGGADDDGIGGHAGTLSRASRRVGQDVSPRIGDACLLLSPSAPEYSSSLACASCSISPTHYNADGTLHQTTRYWTSGLTLPT